MKVTASWTAMGVAVLLGICGLWLTCAPAYAQLMNAARRAAERSAAQAAERSAIRAAEQSAARATERSTVRAAERDTAAAKRRTGAPAPRLQDRVTQRWSTPLCSRQRPCPLPAGVGSSFRAGSYNEVVLGRDTIFYRTYSNPAFRAGSASRYSYWSRSPARGTQAVIDRAIPVSRNGNVANRQVGVLVPKGIRIFEGEAAAIRGGPVGGGNQVVLDGARRFKLID